MAIAYPSTLTINEVLSADKVLAAGVFNELGVWGVPAQNLYGMGYAEQSGQQNARGRIGLDLKDNQAAPAAIEGVFRIVAVDANDVPVGPNGGVIAEFRTEDIRTIGTRGDMIAFPEHGLFLSEDNKFKFLFKPDAAATVVKANSKALINVSKLRG